MMLDTLVDDVNSDLMLNRFHFFEIFVERVLPKNSLKLFVKQKKSKTNLFC
jgi:hypothetical protein